MRIKLSKHLKKFLKGMSVFLVILGISIILAMNTGKSALLVLILLMVAFVAGASIVFRRNSF